MSQILANTSADTLFRGIFDEIGTTFTFGPGDHQVLIVDSNRITVSTGAGNDDVTIEGAGANIVRLEDGDDRYDAFFADDDQIAFGGAGDDFLQGGLGDDRLHGDDGHDILIGDYGTDTLVGGAGNDLLIGGSGRDRLEGGLGDDTFIPGLGDTVVMGPGEDVLDLSSLYGSRGTLTVIGFNPEMHNIDFSGFAQVTFTSAGMMLYDEDSGTSVFARGITFDGLFG